ncbi:MAG: tRNA (N6-threonylcarbamoyladenosine(37)-N6)-methyltransferase TrmO [Spirochaetales bacterium]|nr:tRNA (N6-threonylcarbamoyladenosine(37)-N6)-methyltransferase TrmO [Spirochaetales bacterium]
MNNEQFTVESLGIVAAAGNGFRLVFRPEYRDALTGLEGFSHLQVLFWFHLHDTPEQRKTITCSKPYAKAPDVLGIFATRSDYRPNPIGLSICPVKGVNRAKGFIELFYIDAEDETPIIDVKPYHPAVDRVREAGVPGWCRHWPQWYEDSGDFDWGSEFMFPA